MGIDGCCEEKFNVGDEVRVVRSIHGSGLVKGQQVILARRIDSLYEGRFNWQTSTGTTSGCWISGEEIELVTKKKSFMGSIKQFVKESLLSKEEKSLRKNGLKDSCGDYTAEARDIVIEKLTKENEAYLIEVSIAKDKEEKESKDK